MNFANNEYFPINSLLFFSLLTPLSLNCVQNENFLIDSTTKMKHLNQESVDNGPMSRTRAEQIIKSQSRLTNQIAIPLGSLTTFRTSSELTQNSRIQDIKLEIEQNRMRTFAYYQENTQIGSLQYSLFSLCLDLRTCFNLISETTHFVSIGKVQVCW